MSVLFYKELGFSKTDIGIYSKGLGWITTITFTLIGGLLTIKSGVIKSIFFGNIHGLYKFIICFIGYYGKNYTLFAFAVIIDDIALFATVAFVAFISQLIDRNYYCYPIRIISPNWNIRPNNTCFIIRRISRLFRRETGLIFL